MAFPSYQRSEYAHGSLSLTAGETKSLSQATWENADGAMAEFDAGSGTTLAERLGQEAFYADDADPDNPPVMRVGIQSVQDAPDLALDLVDIWVYMLTGSDRGVGWPPQTNDEASVLSILGSMAPVPP